MMDSEEPRLTMSSSMNDATNYHRYQWDLFSRMLGRRVIEIGPGFGQYTRRILDGGSAVFACDLDERHLQALQSAISSDSLHLAQLDLQRPESAADSLRNFQADTVILLNVLEHIETDRAALRFLRSIVSPGARLILLVPSHQWIYNGLDRQAGHYRRYTRKTLSQTAAAAGWETAECRYVNAPGIPGWIAAGVISRFLSPREQLDAPSTNSLVRLYDRWFTGLSRLSDRFCGPICGLSVFFQGEAS